AGALGSSDKMKFTGARITFEQPVQVKYIGGNQLTIIEPMESAFPDISLELTFARYDATSHAFFAAHRDGTKYKADLTFTGAPIDATSFYGLQFQFPNLDVKEFAASVPGGADQVTPRITLNGLLADRPPAGMTDLR